MPEKRSDMIGIFQEAQKRIHNHSKLVEMLTSIYLKVDTEAFWDSFRQLLLHSLVVFKRELAVERIIEFVVQFATSFHKTNDDMPDLHPFPNRLLTFLLEVSNAWDKAVRYRSCQLVSKILKCLGDDVEIDDELFDRIHGRMLERLRDKVPAVRLQAVLASTRLQNLQDKTCPVIAAFQNMLENDPNVDIRRAVLSSITITTRTLPSILERSRDTKEAVRQATYEVLADKVHIKALSIAQRVSLLERGLSDRSECVKEACSSRLLQAWLKTCEGNVLDLLKCLDVSSSVEACRLALKALFKTPNPQELADNFDLLDDRKLIPADKLTVQSVFYWRELCDYLHSLGGAAEDVLDSLLPLPASYAEYLRDVFEGFRKQTDVIVKLKNDFIMEHLLQLALLLDFSDDAGRKQYMKLMRELLEREEVGIAVVEPLVAWFKAHQPNADARVAGLMEIISDIRCPISVEEEEKRTQQMHATDVKLAALKMQLNEARDMLDSLVKAQDFNQAATYKTKMTELEAQKQALLAEREAANQATEPFVEKNDSQTLMKCLSIAAAMLVSLPIKTWLPRIQSLVDNLIVPSFPNADPAVRNAAVRALGLACLLSRDLATRHFLLFVQASQLDHEVIQVTAIKTLVDLLLIYGLQVFDISQQQSLAQPVSTASEDNDEDLFMPSPGSSQPPAIAGTQSTAVSDAVGSSVLRLLIEHMDSESSDVRTAAVEGMAKLMLSGGVQSSALLSRLLLLWYNPLTEEDVRLRSCLGVFFPIYAFSSRSHQQLFEAAFIPTLKTLFDAPPTSSLASVNVNNVIELLVQITNWRHLASAGGTTAAGSNNSESNLHDEMALAACNEVLLTPNVLSAQRLCRALTLLEPSKNPARLRELLVVVERLFKVVKDKQCLKLIERFAKTIRESLGIETERQKHSDDDEEDAANISHLPDPETVIGEEEEEDTLLMGSAEVSRIKRKTTTAAGPKTKAKSASSAIQPTGAGRDKADTKKPKARQSKKSVVPRDENDDDVFVSPLPVAKKGDDAGSSRPTRAASQPTRTRKNLDSVLSVVDNEAPPEDILLMMDKCDVAKPKATRSSRKK